MTNFLKRWAAFVVLVAVWQGVTQFYDDPFFPPPTKIGEAAYKLWLTGPPESLYLTDVVYDDLAASMAKLLGGWVIASVVGISLGVALGRSQTALEFVGPVLTFMRSIPPPALVPVFMLLFKIGPAMQVATIVFGILWPILLNTIDGARSVDATKVETSRVFRVPKHQWVL
ncbi:MAG: ABC transporter permease subunit, partial [Umezawaea sp.]